MIIRVAGKLEGESVFEFLFKNGMHEENALPQAPLDPVRAKGYIWDLCASEGRLGIVILAERAGTIIGSIGAAVEYAAWFSCGIILYEKWIYVHPDHRRSSCALRMLRFLDDYAKAKRVPLSVGVQVKHDGERKAQLVGRVFEQTGYYFRGGADAPLIL